MQIVVVGCGVSGLSSAIRLQEGGHEVRIWTRDVPPNITSNIAAAIWHPYKAFPIDRVVGWGQRTYAVLRELAQTPATGVTLTEGLEVYREPVDDPWWRDCIEHFRRATPEELGSEYKDGYVFDSAVVETPIYLTYLISRFQGLGGVIEQREVTSLSDPLAQSDIVVNCTGLGARTLLDDAELFPIRGQILRTTRPDIERIMLDEDEEYGVTYVVPRSGDCILGGTAQVGNWSLEPSNEDAAGIIDRCSHLAPAVRGVTVLEQLVGLRPGRTTVRLEVEKAADGKLVVHNYGHGGAGITLSWGCAEEVSGLVQAHADNP